ncbi:hypothetical protein GQ54DRAFT_153460 [Martensiomyces pterosporus]|nr:hypothetical protein GQ54DRAFT_153460 [Martensiomyces pterosporus]
MRVQERVVCSKWRKGEQQRQGAAPGEFCEARWQRALWRRAGAGAAGTPPLPPTNRSADRWIWCCAIRQRGRAGGVAAAVPSPCPTYASLQHKVFAATRTPTLTGTIAGSGARAAPGLASALAAAPAPPASSEPKARAGDESLLRGRARALSGLLGVPPSVDSP